MIFFFLRSLSVMVEIFSTTTWFQIKPPYTQYYKPVAFSSLKTEWSLLANSGSNTISWWGSLPGHVFNKAWKEAPWRVLSIKAFHTILVKLNEQFLCDSETMIENCFLYRICMVSKNTIWLYYSQCPFCRRVRWTSAAFSIYKREARNVSIITNSNWTKYEWIERKLKFDWLTCTSREMS